MRVDALLEEKAIDTMHALKRLVQAGVRVFSYLEDREIALGSFQDNTMTFLRAQFAAEEREKARQRTYDALLRKAKAGHVTGGRVFGYDNVEIRAADGRRSHVERLVNDQEAAVVRRIFELCGAGQGYARIAKALNAASALEGTKKHNPTRTRARGEGGRKRSTNPVLSRPRR